MANFFANFRAANAANASRSFNDILAELSVKDTCELVSDIHVINIVVDGCFEQKIDKTTNLPVTVLKDEKKRFVTFMLDKEIVGMDYTGEVDATGKLVRTIGMTNRISISYYALIGVLKRTPETLFALPAIVADINQLNFYFAGCSVDVLCEYVAAKTPWHNPFASDQEDAVKDEDKVYHHLIKISLGALGIAKLQNILSAH